MDPGIYAPATDKQQSDAGHFIAALTVTAAALNVAPSGTQVSNITDASVAHALNATFSDTEAEAALNALGVKINLILDALEAYGIMAPAA